MVLVEAGDLIPGDGDTIEGVASVKESAITGESAPVIREAGATARLSRSTVLTDWIRVKITAAPGSTFIDRMIPLVEGAERQKTPNELALSILLSGLTIIFLIVCVTLSPLAGYSGTVLSVTVLIALLVCLFRQLSAAYFRHVPVLQPAASDFSSVQRAAPASPASN
jgi:potassium-transporting ATPase ATP-binding subunit